MPAANGSHYDEQIHGGEIGKKERQSHSHPVDRSRAEEAKAVRNTQGHVDVHTQAATEGHVCVNGPTTARVCVAVHGCHQRPHRCLKSGLLSVAMLVSEGSAITGPCRSGWPDLPLEAIVSSRP